MRLVCIGLNHETAPVEVRERVAFDADGAAGFLARPDETSEERVLLSTCNRTELYATGEADDLAEHLAAGLDRERGSTAFADPEIRYVHEGRDAALHLAHVACGLDSMVLGEDQILGQVDEAHRIARGAGSTGAVLTRLFESASHLGGKMRAETDIGRGTVSISSAAVGLADKIFGSLEGRQALVIGAGQMGALAARHLRGAGVETVRIANRTVARAQALSEEIGGQPVPLCGIPAEMAQVDVVVSAVAGGVTMLNEITVRGALRSRSYRPLLIVDVSVPRSVDPSIRRLENVFLQDVDALRNIIDANLAKRRKAAKGVTRECEALADRFVGWWRTLSVEPTLRDLRGRLDALAEQEVARTLKRVPGEHRSDLERLTRSLVNKILHAPMTRLRRRAESRNGVTDRLAVLRELFDLEETHADPDRDQE